MKKGEQSVCLSIVFVAEMIVQGKAVISVSCVQVQEHEGLGRKRNDARQGRVMVYVIIVLMLRN